MHLAVGFYDHAMEFQGPRLWVIFEFFLAVSIVVHEARAFRMLKTLMKHAVTDMNGVEPFRAAVFMSSHGCKGWLGVPGARGGSLCQSWILYSVTHRKSRNDCFLYRSFAADFYPYSQSSL